MSVAVTIPFAFDAAGGVATTTDERRQLVDAVQATVATLPGERVMRLAFGVATSRFLFLPSPELAAAEIRQEIIAGVQRWVPEAVVESVDFDVVPSLSLVDARVQIARSDIPGREQANSRIVGISQGGTVSESS
ncbi:GPW/gp25 family protein [Kitasatospora purpeofusca]|uniref:GPW/gp25 family protein n=1 Tax=Kitasatospora purpeofusca TaxID=67352 RepID=UPI0036AA0E2F